jgi:hypothetical protein
MEFLAAIFAEGYFERIVRYPTIEEAKAFCNGVGTGASFYGAGSCGAYVLFNHEDEEEMRQFTEPAEVEKAYAAARADTKVGRRESP